MNLSARPGFVPFDRRALERSIPDRFVTQVRSHGDRSAVEVDGRVIDYRDLNARANQIAHALLSSGSDGRPVALIADYDIPLIAGLLGVLKSGVPFVPLDPSFPVPRSESILSDARCGRILCDVAHRPLAQELAGSELRVVGMEDARGDDGDPDLEISPHADAYILYTSGSTGRPKGVVQSHRIVLHNILKYTNNLAVDHEDRWSLLFSLCFGEAMNDAFSALLNGGAVCLYDLRKRGAARLADWIARERITVYHSVPGVYRRMLDGSAPEGGFPHLRAVVMGGEPVHRADVDLHRERFASDCVLVNAYGSTETKLIRQYVLDGRTEVRDGCLPVGYPVEDTEVVILDAQGEEMSAGQAGEIAVRSGFLARYWTPSLSDDRFSQLVDGRRQFRTGDLGRLDDDGCLHHLSRIDDQVKIRGHRIEPAEVEAACLGLDSVREAVVTAVDSGGPDARLVAYLVTQGDPPSGGARLRRSLAKRLPSFMIPSQFVFLDSLPLTLTGKVDRRALPAPDVGPGPALAEPMKPTARRVAQIWESALDLPAVGQDDDFFALGGDSLAAVSIVVGIEQAFGRRFSYSVLVEKPTVRELAAVLDGQDEASRWTPRTERLVELMASGEKTPFFCVHPNSGSALGYMALARELSGRRPVYAFQARGLSGVDPPHRRIEDMASDYLEELLVVQPTGPYLLSGRCNGGIIAYEMARQLQRRGERVALLVIVEEHDPPNLISKNRLLRALAPLGRVHGRLLGMSSGELERERDLPAGSRYRVKAVFQSLYRARSRYATEPYPGRVALVLADNTEEDGVPPAVHRWRACVVGKLEWIVASGSNHWTLLEDPYVADVASRLDALLDQAEESCDP